MNELLVADEINIENIIYEIREKQVMLDSDLAKLYHVETKRINEAVKNNPNKFPERFSFILSEYEKKYLWSKFSTANISNMSRVNPRVFTEQGVAMLATILKSKIATDVSIRIMDAFVSMRHYISDNLLEQKYINNLVFQHDNDIKLLKDSFDKFEEKKKINDIYFDGQIYDAYSKVLDIFKQSRLKLVIIDSYADKIILDIIRRLSVDVILITKKDNLLTKQDIEKYNKQYHNLEVIYSNLYHDRYFIIDDSIVYHCGASINRIGYKTFSVTLVNDKDVCNLLINRLNSFKKTKNVI